MSHKYIKIKGVWHVVEHEDVSVGPRTGCTLLCTGAAVASGVGKESEGAKGDSDPLCEICSDSDSTLRDFIKSKKVMTKQTL